MADLLRETYKKYLAERQRLETELVAVKLKIAGLEEAGATAYTIVGEDHILAPTPSPTEDITMTQRVFDIVDSITYEHRARRARIRKILEARGYVSKSENFDVTLFKTLIRLKKQGRINGELIEKVWYFWQKLGKTP